MRALRLSMNAKSCRQISEPYPNTQVGSVIARIPDSQQPLKSDCLESVELFLTLISIYMRLFALLALVIQNPCVHAYLEILQRLAFRLGPRNNEHSK